MNKIIPKIAFLGGIFPEQKKNEIINNSIGQPQNAANLLQWNIINGIEKNINEHITIFNSLFIGSYPKRFKKLFIKSYEFSHCRLKEHCDYNIGFFNAPLIKHLSKIIEVKRFLHNKAKINEYDLIIGYSMTLSIVEGLLCAKRINPNLITCLVVPDLPEYMNLEKKKRTLQDFLFNSLRKVSNEILYKDIQKIDCFVILTKYMADALGIENKPYSVIEGMTKPRNEDCIYEYPIKKFVYTGSLGEKYGIKELVDAFHKLEVQDVELIICGGGDTVDYIKTIAKIDTRIIYKGILTPDEVYNIQKDAYVLVNPRNSKEEYTKYSFPSKTLEYMTSGHPVLMYHLPGIPKEYDDYLIYFEEGEEAIYHGLKKIYSLDPVEIRQIGLKSKVFVDTQKTDIIQTKKIIEMFYEIKAQNRGDKLKNN